jgi:hypothetical protein
MTRLTVVSLAVVLVAVTAQCGGSIAPVYITSPTDSTGPVCVHLEDPYSERLCPNLPETEYFTPSQVTAETLIVVTASGTRRIALNPRTDAIFLSQSAMSTFLLRHYDATNRPRGDSLREYLRGRYRPKPR